MTLLSPLPPFLARPLIPMISFGRLSFFTCHLSVDTILKVGVEASFSLSFSLAFPLTALFYHWMRKSRSADQNVDMDQPGKLWSKEIFHLESIL